MKILGISAWYHDSAAALIVDGKIVAAAQEERFTRKKHDPDFPEQAIRYCLEEAGCEINDIEAIAFYDKPFLKFERLLETAYAIAPVGLGNFLKAMPVWMKDKLFMKKMLTKAVHKIGEFDFKAKPILFPEHHLSHAASAFYPSPYQHAAILTVDGVGEWATATIGAGKGSKITIHKELHFPHSIGLLYSAFTYFLGFKVNDGEYKLMGLAPYAQRNSDQVAKYADLIREHLITINDDGSLWLHMDEFAFLHKDRMIKTDRWEKIFGMKRREPESALEEMHCQLALGIQLVTEEVVLKMAKTAKELTGADYLCMAGGVALNCVANGVLHEQGLFKDIFVQPASSDAGGAIGAALSTWYITKENERSLQQPDAMNGSLLGPTAAPVVPTDGIAQKDFEQFDDVCAQVSDWLNEGKVVGWVQGRMEFGPRALGCRSILGDPRHSDMQAKLNLKIKKRESFRPFAPAVLEEDANTYFEHNLPAPYMTVVKPVREEYRKPLPDNFSELDLMTKLKTDRSELPAITHIDFSARIQTVSEQSNPYFHKLLATHKRQHGLGMLVNTSFNVRSEPIVCSGEDAWNCFMNTDMDVLVINNTCYLKDA